MRYRGFALGAVCSAEPDRLKSPIGATHQRMTNGFRSGALLDSGENLVAPTKPPWRPTPMKQKTMPNRTGNSSNVVTNR